VLYFLVFLAILLDIEIEHIHHSLITAVLNRYLESNDGGTKTQESQVFRQPCKCFFSLCLQWPDPCEHRLSKLFFS